MKATKRDPRVYLRDILAAIDRVQKYASRGKDEFLTDGLLQDGVIRQLAIVGEAAAKVPERVRARAPDVPWREIVGMRNILVHEYAEVNLERVWETVVRDLPQFQGAVKRMLRDGQATGRSRRKVA